MHVKEIYVIFIHLFDSGILLIIDLSKKKGKKRGGGWILFVNFTTGAGGMDLPPPFFLTFCLQIYFQ